MTCADFRYDAVIEGSAGRVALSSHDNHRSEEGTKGLTDGAPLHVDLTDTDRRIIDALMAPSRAWFLCRININRPTKPGSF
ncbi:hypothetical protein ACFXO7_32595, partial [Nocardia tengchongensis]